MAPPPTNDPSLEEEEDDYDESADSDFDMSGVDDDNGSASSSSEAEAEAEITTPSRSRKRRKIEKPKPTPQKEAEPVEPELDSGDEATLREARKIRRKQLKTGEDVDGDDQKDEGWRAKTRSMRQQEQEEKKSSKLATIKGSTVDVDALWERLNAPDALKLLSSQPKPDGEAARQGVGAQEDGASPTKRPTAVTSSSNKENILSSASENTVNNDDSETITITRTYTFAGETNTETKVVSKSSAEARLWLAQQSSTTASQSVATKLDNEGRTIQRPLRKISRFDPNASNIDAFKGRWTSTLAAGKKGPTGPKLNVVEKSKMDWASHVDAEGLKEELDVAAKAKNSYLHRTDFLRDVEMRKEEEARNARLGLRGQ